MKLLEEEEKEKREEEERKERRRTKEREKKLRRKERLKGKEKDKNFSEPKQSPNVHVVPEEASSIVVDEEPNNSISCSKSIGESGDNVPSRPGSPDVKDEQLSNGHINSRTHNSFEFHDGEINFNGSFSVEVKYTRRRSKLRKDVQADPSVSVKWPDRRRYTVVPESGANRSEIRCFGDNFESQRAVNLSNKQSRVNGTKSNSRHCGLKFGEKLHCSSNGRTSDRYDFHSCSCNQNTEYRAKVEPHVSRIGGETKSGSKSESVLDISKQFYRGNKYNQIDHMHDSCGRPKSKFVSVNSSARDLHSKKVWEPLESQKKYARSNSDSDVTLKPSAFKVEGAQPNSSPVKSSGGLCSGEFSVNSCEVDEEDNNVKESTNSTIESDLGCQNGRLLGEGEPFYSKKGCDETRVCVDNSALNYVNSTSNRSSNPITSISSSSDNCSSCLSEEGDSNTASSNLGNHESSSTSDSEDSSLQSEEKETSDLVQNNVSECQDATVGKNQNANGGERMGGRTSGSHNGVLGNNAIGTPTTKIAHAFDNGLSAVNMGSQHQSTISPMHFPVFQAPSTLGYYHQNPVSWPAAPNNGLIPFSHPNHYLYADPLGYGMNGNSRFCMQYGPMQHLATPLYAPGPVPFYQPIAKANVINPEEQTQISKPHVQEAPNVATEDGTDPVGRHSTQAAPSGEGFQRDDPGKPHDTGDKSFSLFHFGGPVALSTGCKPNPVPSKEEIVGDFSTKCPTDPVEGDTACNKKEATIEEYNLFAASNGISFSFF